MIEQIEIKDNTLYVLSAEDISEEKLKETIDKIDSLADERNYKVCTLAFDKHVNVDTHTLEDGSIIMAKLSKDYYNEINSRYIADSIKSVLDDTGIDKKVGILVIREPSDVIVMPDSELLRLGLLKISTIEKILDDEDFNNFMTKLGFEKKEPFSENKDEQVEIEVEKEYIVHENEDNSLAFLAANYDVPVNKCISSKSTEFNKVNQKEYYHLYPRLDNNYQLPDHKGR